MKNIGSRLSLAALAGVALVLVGCRTTPLQEETAPPPVVERSTPPATTTTPAPDPRAVQPVDTRPSALDPLNDPSSPLSRRSVYFDFDQFVVKPEFTSTVEAHGRFLVANKDRRVVIEGNADERGSREYNLALGQKRAEAVKSRLALLGVTENQIETVSFGEEKPRATGSNEEAWAQNRRADIVYR